MGGATTSPVLLPPELSRTGPRDTHCVQDTHVQVGVPGAAPAVGRSVFTTSDGDLSPSASSPCVLCSAGGNVTGLLMCCCCGDCYHSSCLDPPLTPSALCRAGWQCPRCRVCQSCR